MRHAVYLPPIGSFGDIEALIELAVDSERAGWDGFFLWDHLLYATDVPIADPWIAMAAISCRTSTIRLGPLVTPIPRRRPWRLAREAVTVDRLSAGRLTLGVGLGIDFWREFSAFGEPATNDRVRAELADEGIDVLRGLWSGEPFSYSGAHLEVDNVRFLPTPVQRPTIPIWVAALWPLRSGPRRRALGCDGIVPFSPTGTIDPADVAALRADLGVGPAFDVCLHGPQDWAEDYREAGVTWLCLPLLAEMPLEEARARILAGPPA